MPTTRTNALPRHPRAALLRQERHDLRDLLGATGAVLHRRRCPLPCHEPRINIVQALRHDRARIHRVHGGAVAAQLRGPDAREALERRLAARVRAGVGEARAPADAADVDDAPGPPQARQHGLRQEQRAAHVDGVHAVKGLGGDGVERRAADDGGVVDENVNTRAKGPGGRGDDLRRRVGVAKVALDGGGGAVGFGLDAGDELLRRLVGGVTREGDGNSGPARREIVGDGLADTAGRARDDGAKSDQ